MESIRKEKKLCLACMQEHEVDYVCIPESITFKGAHVEYDAIYEYCKCSEVYSESEELSSENDVTMKDAYRKAMGLLTSCEIIEIRKKYEISQSDLCTLLGWGEKTVTRYESHQVQDFAHDTILRKLGEDPEWFLSLLRGNRTKFRAGAYLKYSNAAIRLYENACEIYKRRAIYSRYVRYENKSDFTGNTQLNLDKVVDIIGYFSNSKKTKSLYKVKAMKMLWYSDALSYKRNGKSMTGLVYRALAMGAVPIEYDAIINLGGIKYEEINFGDGCSACHFLPVKNREYKHLTQSDIEILDKIIEIFGSSTKDDIVNKMHNEKAYINTEDGAIINYKYAKELSID